MSIARKAISGALWMSGVSYVGFAVNFVIQLILVRLLVPEDFGVFALGLAAAEMLFIFFGWGFHMAAVQIQKAEHLLDTAFYLSLLSGLIVFVIGGVVSLVLSRYYATATVIVFFALCTLQMFQAGASIYAASLEKELQFTKIAIVRGIATNLSGVFAVLMAYIGFGVWSLLGKEAFSSMSLFFGLRAIASYRVKRQFSKETAKALLDFGFKRLLVRGLEILYFKGPIFLLGNLVSARSLGLFTQAFYLANLPNALLGPAQQNVGFAVYSKIQSDKSKINQAFYRTNFFSLSILMPMMLLMYITPEPILNILYGAKWIEAAPILKYLSIYAAFLPLVMNAVILLYALNRLNDIAKIYSTQIAVWITAIVAFQWILISDMSWSGMTYSISLLSGFLMGLYYLGRDAITIPFTRLFVPPIAVTIMMAILSRFLIGKLPPLDNWSKLLTIGFLLSLFVLFGGILFFIRPFEAVGNIRFVYEKLKRSKGTEVLVKE